MGTQRLSGSSATYAWTIQIFAMKLADILSVRRAMLTICLWSLFGAGSNSEVDSWVCPLNDRTQEPAANS